MKKSYKKIIEKLSHQHTKDIDSLDGSRFYTTEVLPDWLQISAIAMQQQPQKILSDCISYRNSMAYQHNKKKGITA